MSDNEHKVELYWNAYVFSVLGVATFLTVAVLEGLGFHIGEVAWGVGSMVSGGLLAMAGVCVQSRTKRAKSTAGETSVESETAD